MNCAVRPFALLSIFETHPFFPESCNRVKTRKKRKKKQQRQRRTRTEEKRRRWKSLSKFVLINFCYADECKGISGYIVFPQCAAWWSTFEDQLCELLFYRFIFVFVVVVVANDRAYFIVWCLPFIGWLSFRINGKTRRKTVPEKWAKRI